jgi:putative von willebrand factor type A domain protein
MVNSWVVPATVSAAAILAFVVWRWGGVRRMPGIVYVAHTGVLRSSRRYRTRVAQLRFAVAGIAACAALAVFSAAVIVARPSHEKVSSQRLASRDIVLCLDVSGSVIGFDSKVLATFSKMVRKFEGERVGLVVFNSSARVVFPLTDDYDMIQKELESAVSALDSGRGSSSREFSDLIAGTVNGKGSSLIGDGLVSCTHSFDYKEKDRSRTILFATDNELLGTPLFQLDEACALAKKRRIRVYGLLIDDRGYGGYRGSSGKDAPGEFSSEIGKIGGTVYEAKDSEAGERIVKKVQAQDEAELAGDVDVSIVDEPRCWPAFALVGVLGIIGLAWKFRLS